MPTWKWEDGGYGKASGIGEFLTKYSRYGRHNFVVFLYRLCLLTVEGEEGRGTFYNPRFENVLLRH